MSAETTIPQLSPTLRSLRDGASIRGLSSVVFEEHGRHYLRIGNPSRIHAGSLEIIARTSLDTGRINHAATYDNKTITLGSALDYMSRMAS